ncbi:MAG TPA: D-alanyl-D-alanine carboxypeptidase, partial [Yinghuangia sp.]|nr:D-alanyl-D-alanine carboxypeptidase [Yinghuangia sp.]
MHPTDAGTVGHHTPGGKLARAAASRLRRIVALAAITSLLPLSGTAVASTAQASVDAVATPGGRASAADEAIARFLDQRITDTRLGPRVSGFVMDAESDNVVWQYRGTEALMPASNAKLFTAVAALAVLGPGHRFPTHVVQGPDALTLVGGGDRTLTTADLAELARTTAARLRAVGVLRIQVRVDDSLFGEPSLANGWNDGYYPGSVAPVRALVVDGRPLMDTGLDAGQEFARQLTAAGIDVVGAITRDEADSEAPVVARHDSGELAEIVPHMLRTSDNNIAESLLRATALG